MHVHIISFDTLCSGHSSLPEGCYIFHELTFVQGLHSSLNILLAFIPHTLNWVYACTTLLCMPSVGPLIIQVGFWQSAGMLGVVILHKVVTIKESG